MSRQVLVLPEDKEMEELLTKKLAEYKDRVGLDHPDLHTAGQRDAFYKVRVLEKLLAEKLLDTWAFSQELIGQFGSRFSLGDFNNACGVVRAYISGEFPIILKN